MPRSPALPLQRALLAATCVAALGAAALGARPVQAQRRPTETVRRDSANAPTLPGDVARLVTEVYNAPATRRGNGPFALAASDTVAGDLAVLGGPVTIAGLVTGRLVVINGDLTLRPGARVQGDVLVVGGVVEGRNLADLAGELRVHRQLLAFHREGTRLVPDDVDDDDRPSAYVGWRAEGERGDRTYVGLRLASAQGYNRVEGLPILAGPTLTYRLGDVRLRVDALGIYRTAGAFEPDGRDLGHDVRAEVRLGRGAEVRFGGRLYDEVAPIEDWKLTPLETGLASFLLHRDYRDYWNRHGGSVWTALHLGPDLSLSATLADQRWRSLEARDPFTLFRNGAPWRANPTVDEARQRVLNLTLRVDTRNDADSPWAGWYVLADYEHGEGDVSRFGALSSDPRPLVDPAPGVVRPPGARDRTPGRRAYGRGFLDVRRYNRLSPDAQLNLRLVTGGWLHGDALPVQRRLSVTGPGAMPGFDFRVPAGRDADVGNCSQPAGAGVGPVAGAPAQCDRMLMTQVEFRNDIRVRLLGDDGLSRPRLRSFRRTASWVVFADAGRGWLVDGARAGTLAYGRDQLPSLGSWLADVGAGLDFSHGRATGEVGAFGVYVAKSVSSPDQPLNFLVRVRRRF